MTNNGGNSFEFTLPSKMPCSPGPKRFHKSTSETKTTARTHESLLSIPIQWLCLKSRIPFTIYAGPTIDKMSTIIDYNRIYTHRYKSKLVKAGIDKCCIKKESIPELLYYVDNNIETILSNKDISPKDKTNLFYHTALRRTKRAFERPGRESFLRIREIIAIMLEDILEDKETMNPLFILMQHNHRSLCKPPIYTFTHSLNVGILATFFVKRLLNGIDRNNLEMIGLGFLLHDIGMLKVPGRIINKKASLNKGDSAVIKQHPKWGYDVMNRVGNIPSEATYIIMEHHERLNGKGYPFQLKGENIHLFARICAIMDTFDALISERIHKRAVSIVEALKTIQKRVPYEYDRDLFSALIILLLDTGLIKT